MSNLDLLDRFEVQTDLVLFFKDANADMLLPLIGDYEINTLKVTCEEVLLAREMTVKLLLQAQQSQVS